MNKLSDEKKQIIIDAISKFPTNMSAAARETGLPFKTFVYRAQVLGIYNPNPHGKRDVKPRSDKIPLDKILSGGHPQYKTNHLKRRLLEEGVKTEECEICGQRNTWNGKSLILQLDHINGINDDHRLNNLRILCPNCHTQTDTYCGRNKKLENDSASVVGTGC